MLLLLLFLQNTNQEVSNSNQATRRAGEEFVSAGQAAQNTIVEMVNGFFAKLPVIAVGVIVFLIFFGIAYVVRRIVVAGTGKAGIDSMLSSLLARISYFVVIVIGFFVAIAVIFPTVTPGSLIAGLGIGSVALGFAFKDVLQNLFAGFLILLYRPFHIGDQLKIKDFEGTVENISVRATNMKTYDGERVVIPNSELYMNAVLVRTAFPHRRTKVIVGIGYGDSIEEARETIMNVLRNTEGVLKEPAFDVNVVELADNAVNLRVLFWTDSVQSSVRKTSDRVFTAIKNALDSNGIDMPFPHMVLMTQEGPLQIEREKQNQVSKSTAN